MISKDLHVCIRDDHRDMVIELYDICYMLTHAFHAVPCPLFPVPCPPLKIKLNGVCMQWSSMCLMWCL